MGSLKFVLIVLTVVFLGFQNCSPTTFNSTNALGSANQGLAIPCGDESCSLDPLTTEPTVTTILLALGDQANNQLVGNPVSNRFLAETVIRYSTPASQPKILLVRAQNRNGESLEDSLYIEELLSNYQVSAIDEPENGLSVNDLEGFDLVWFNNPGHPFNKQKSLQSLLAFSGGVVLQGDDLARGVGFEMTDLTGLKFIDNGTQVSCAGQTFNHDNNLGYQYQVSLDSAKIQGVNASTINFRYGNDIDNTQIEYSDVEVLATAVGGFSANNDFTNCVESRPVVVRRFK